MTTPVLRLDIADQVATLTLDSPRNRNALGAQMRVEMAEAVQAVRRDRTVRALVITGAGGQFCSGGDLRNMAEVQLDSQGWRERMHGLQQVVHDLLTLDRPVIAAVDGAAYGAGFGLALTADFVLATPRARFCMSFMRVGLAPDFGALYTLPRIVGTQRAKELMLSAREVGADEALRLGIAMELQPPEQLYARAQALARSFVGASPTAVSLVKRALAAGGPDLATMLALEADGQAVAFGTEDHRSAVARFLAKEPAKFQWPT
jgi:2-(1,2-epoxy-1,2-dihydrophenyl)acetyl-CoA isomerase